MRLRLALRAPKGRHRISPAATSASRGAGVGLPRARFVPALLVIACCTSPDRADEGLGGPETIVVVDAAGSRVALQEPVRRIVSLVPSATQTLRAIGAAGALVGRTDFDVDAWTASLPSVGGGIGPNLEAIVELRPDLVIRFAGEQDPRTPARLDDLGIRHLAVRPDRVEDILAAATMLGRVTGHEAEAEALRTSIREGLRTIAESAASQPTRRFAYVLGGSPPWVAGPGTYIDEVVSLTGGANVFQDLGALYAAVSPEALRTRDIDVVLVGSEGGFDASLVPGARIELVGDVLEIPGPDVVEAAIRVAAALHGTPRP